MLKLVVVTSLSVFIRITSKYRQKIIYNEVHLFYKKLKEQC